ncbi:MAG: hypothetical protein HWN66_05890 [Candidatus Helarchaeota archaeon]|nr:hypothetical protein [Candidatus Helarchaeota archaeon]
MRHNRGRKWAGYRGKTNSIRNIQPQISRRTNPPLGEKVNDGNFQNYTYIGRCRCGYGPNAYYRTPNGEIVNANQLIQTTPMNQKPQRNLSIPNAPRRLFSPKVEMYRICNRCGARVRDAAYFCTECGNEVGNLPSLTKRDQIEKLKIKVKDLKTRIKVLKKNGL